MIVLSLFQWWYGAGWKSALRHGEKRIFDAYRLFSVPILVRTLFAPWRRIMTNPGPGVNGIFRAIIDNTVSRLVGFLARLIVLICSAFVISIASIMSFLEIVLWVFVPAAVIGLLLLAVVA